MRRPDQGGPRNVLGMLAPPMPWYTRLWLRASTAVNVALGRIDLGADFRPGNTTRPGYDVAASMSAMAAFPWVYAAMMRASGDLSGLPLRVYQERRGKTEELPRTHPLCRLLRRPHPRFTGRQLRRQLYVDYRITGNGFISRLGVGQASTLMRLHPRRVEISPDPNDGYGAYIYTGTGQRKTIPMDQIFHVRGPSWQDDPRGLFGTGMIESLHHDLVSDRRAAQATSVMAKRPRPDIIVSPADKDDILTKEQREELGKQLDKMLGDGGTVVSGNAIKLDLPSWTPRDMEFPALRQLVREAVLAVSGVPPHLVGLPVANYAQSQEQTLCYWELQQGLASDIEDAFLNPFAEQFGEGLYVVHDFSKVDALQAGRNSRLGRVLNWWSMGGDPARAARYEGFQDLPEDLFQVAPDPAPSDTGKGKGKTRTARDSVAPVSEEARASAWRSWVERAHQPAERRLSGVISTFLRDQSARLAAKAAELDPAGKAMRRDLIDALLSAIWNELGERQALLGFVRSHIREILVSGWRSSSNQMSLGLAWDVARGDPAVDKVLAELVANVNGTTRAAVRQTILDSLAAAESTAQLQTRLQTSATFAPARALAIGRTEATRSLNAGHLVAYQQAQAAGIMVRKQWLAQAGARDAHAALDGQEREPGEDFVVPAGAPFAGSHAPGPGQFSEAALCVNCRCTTIPIVLEE